MKGIFSIRPRVCVSWLFASLIVLSLSLKTSFRDWTASVWENLNEIPLHDAPVSIKAYACFPLIKISGITKLFSKWVQIESQSGYNYSWFVFSLNWLRTSEKIGDLSIGIHG